MFSGDIKAAFSSLRSSKWRSMLTMTGIVVGITLVVTIVSLGEGLKQQVVGHVNQLGSDVLTVRSGRLVSREPGQAGQVNLLAFLSSSTLSLQDVAALNKLPAVEDVTPVNFVTNTASSAASEVNNAYVLGTSPALPRLLQQKIAFGSFFEEKDSELKLAVIGNGIAQKLYDRRNPVGHTINVAGQPYIIRGVLAPSAGGLLSVGQIDFNSAVFIDFTQSTELTAGSNILQILLRSRSPNPDTAIKEVEKTLLATHQGRQDFTVLKQTELIRVVEQVVNNLTKFVSALAAISLLVGGVGIMNVMLAAVNERTREIGIRKAIGATNRQILKQFLTEGLVITISGGIIGVGLSLLVFGLLRLYTNLQPVITVPIMVLAVGISITVGVIFSIIPAFKAARKDPIQALRGD